MSKLVPIVLGALSVTALVFMPASVGEQRSFGFAYDFGAGWMSPVPAPDPAPIQPVGGIIVCETFVPGTQLRVGAGGVCGGIQVEKADFVTVHAADVVSPEVAYAVCIDTGLDGVCRPEFPDDYLHFETCGDGDNTIAFQHTGPDGLLAIFVMEETDTTPCIPTRGEIWGTIVPPSECNDLVDNDGDGLVDYPADPDCTDPWDSRERPPQCSDGIDNNGNGVADYGADPGCDSPGDETEWSPECSDLKDNDGDGLVDHGSDPDCSGPSDGTERTVYSH